MTDMTSIRDLADGIAPSARADLGRILRHLVHALNTPLSTFTMDVFSAQVLIAKTTEAVRSGSGGAEPLSELAEVCTNLRQASGQLATMSTELSELANKLEAAPPGQT